jgi:hypothetical protein
MEKMSAWRRKLVGWAGLSAVVWPCATARALPRNPEHAPRPPVASTTDAPEEARIRYERAVQLYNDGNVEGALVEFERAYKLAPTYRLLYNIGIIRLQLNDYAEALKAFQAYLAGGGNDIPLNRRNEVDRHIFALKSRVGSVLLSSNAKGAEVSVDDVVVGTIPLTEPLVLNPGQRRITVSRGNVTRSRVVSIAGQDAVALELDLESPRPTAAQVVSLTPPMPESPSRTPAYVLWGVTGALGIAAGIVGVLSLNSIRDVEKERDDAPTTRGQLDDAANKMKALSLTADILAGTAVVAGGAALYFTFRGPSDEGKRMVRARLGPTGVQLEGRF